MLAEVLLDVGDGDWLVVDVYESWQHFVGQSHVDVALIYNRVCHE